MEGQPPVSTEDLVLRGVEAIPRLDIGGESARVWVPGRRLLSVGMVTLITIAASEALAVVTVMPLVEADLGDLPLYGWVFSAFMLGNVVGIVLAGRLADRMWLGWVLTGGLALFVGGLGLASAAPSMGVLVVARALQGIGAGTIPTVATVAVARAYAPEARPRVFALFSTAWIVPALLGPGIASRVGVAIGWRWVFGGLIPLALIVGAVTVIALRGIPSRATDGAGEKVKVGVTLALVLGSAAFLSGLGAQPSWLGTALVLVGLVITVTALARALPPGSLTFGRGLPATVGLKGVFTYSFFAADAFVPLALTGVRGASAELAGAVVTSVSLSWAAFAWVQERWVRRVGPRPLVRIGFGLVAVGVVAIAIVVATDVPVAASFPAWVAAGAGAGLLFAPLSAAGLAAAAAGEEARASSSLLLTETLGIALGTGVAGAIVGFSKDSAWDLVSAVTVVFSISVAVALFGVCLAGRIPVSVLSHEAG